MPELFIPKPLDLLTPALQIRQQQQQGQFREQQLGQGQQRLDLLRENLSLGQQQEQRLRKTAEFDRAYKTYTAVSETHPEAALQLIPQLEKASGFPEGTIDTEKVRANIEGFNNSMADIWGLIEGKTGGGETKVKNLIKRFGVDKAISTIEAMGKARKALEPEAGKDISVNLRDFETVSGIDSSLRGTQEYRNALKSYRKTFEGRNQLVGTTPEGQIVTFNTIDSSISTKDAPAILPKTKKIVSGEIAGQIATMDSLISGISDIRRISLDNPELIGPAVGRWNKLKSRFVDNQDFVELDRNVESMITLAYALSGKQISEREMRMLKTAILPSVTMPGGNFQTALDFAEKWLTVNRDNRIGRLEEFGFFTGKQQRGETVPSPTKRKPLSSFVGE